MGKRSSKSNSSFLSANQRRVRPPFLVALSDVNRRAHERVNQRGGRRNEKSMKAMMAETAPMLDADDSAGPWTRLMRWSLAVALLPLCWVTAWTFLSRFSRMTVNQGLWQSPEFWYFATGVILMLGWFWSGLFQSFFLLLYVLGHELTHALFVKIFRGKVTDFHVSVDGGYITTNKTNFVIALSPYFLPWWSSVATLIFFSLRLFFDLSRNWNLALYGIMGLTWTFHIVWTLWMIPRDQPDLRENGRFLSLVIIFLGNLLVLVALLCVAENSPGSGFLDFGHEWLRYAATWGDAGLRGSHELYQQLRTFGKF